MMSTMALTCTLIYRTISVIVSATKIAKISIENDIKCNFLSKFLLSAVRKRPHASEIRCLSDKNHYLCIG